MLTIGLNPTGIDKTQQFGVNQFGAQADKEYLYVKFSAAVAPAGAVLVIDSDGNAQELTTANDATGNRVGIAGASAGANEYGWALVRGEAEFQAAANCAANEPLRATTVGGVVDDSGTGPVIEGMVAAEAAGAMAEHVKGRLTYPTLQEQAAGGMGASDFTDLGDTPNSLGTAGQHVAVNSGATALEFVAAPSGGGADDFTDLNDTPNSLGTAGQTLQVNSGATALEFADRRNDLISFWWEQNSDVETTAQGGRHWALGNGGDGPSLYIPIAVEVVSLTLEMRLKSPEATANLVTAVTTVSIERVVGGDTNTDRSGATISGLTVSTTATSSGDAVRRKTAVLTPSSTISIAAGSWIRPITTAPANATGSNTMGTVVLWLRSA